MGAMKVGALERYSQRMGRLVERHLAEAALIAARQLAEREAAEAKAARREIEITATALREEVAERERTQARLAYLATHDPLTALPNRTWFNDALAERVREAGGQNRKVALAYLDLDNFKDVNDTLGHEVGDQLLCLVAERLMAALKPGQSVARIGGDEFALIMPDARSAHAAAGVASALIALLRTPFEIANRPIFVGASAGVSLFPDDAGDTDLLHRHADLALYRAKADGRNRCTIFDQSVHDEVERRWNRRCASPACSTSCRSPTSRRSTCAPDGFPASRRYCAGSTRGTAGCGRRNSFLPPNAPARFCRSANGCCWNPAARRRAGWRRVCRR